MKLSSSSNWSTWLSNYQFITLCIYLFYLLLLYYLISMNLSASKNIIMTFHGYIEEWNSKFPHFKISFPCLVWTLISFTLHLMSLDFIILPFTAETAKDIYRTFPYLHRHFAKICLVISVDSINKQKYSFTSWCISCDWLHRDNCAF